MKRQKKAADEYSEKKGKIQGSLDSRLDALMKKEEEGKQAIEDSAAQEAAKIKQTAQDEAKAKAQVEIAKNTKQISDEAAKKVESEKSEFKEDLGPIEAQIAKLQKETALYEKQTQEMKDQARNHANKGQDAMTKVHERHTEQWKNFAARNRGSESEVAASSGESNFGTLAALGCFNIVMAGGAFTYWRSIRKMRGFHASMLEF